MNLSRESRWDEAVADAREEEVALPNDVGEAGFQGELSGLTVDCFGSALLGLYKYGPTARLSITAWDNTVDSWST